MGGVCGALSCADKESVRGGASAVLACTPLMGAATLGTGRAGMRDWVDSGKIPGVLTAVARHGNVAYMESCGVADVATQRCAADRSCPRTQSCALAPPPRARSWSAEAGAWTHTAARRWRPRSARHRARAQSVHA